MKWVAGCIGLIVISGIAVYVGEEIGFYRGMSKSADWYVRRIATLVYESSKSGNYAALVKAGIVADYPENELSEVDKKNGPVLAYEILEVKPAGVKCLVKLRVQRKAATEEEELILILDQPVALIVREQVFRPG
ncbi:MAG: hypothetical protein JSS66_16530 [Armatimonadetes bacterium]|nr:hypothetical protein [Armatimonadota bacterium]